MNSVLALAGIILALFGALCGIVNWYLTEFYLATVDWEGPLVMVNSAAWLLNVLCLGAGAILIGLAVMQPPDEP